MEIAKRDISTIKKRDVISAIDGNPVGPFTVIKPLHVIGESTQTITVRMSNNREVNLYPDTNIADSVTIERPKRAPQTRTIAGIRIVNTGPKEWQTTDGRYVIAYDEAGYTTCDGPHPMSNGEYCYGTQSHMYYGWMVADAKRDNDPTGAIEYADSLNEAVSILADILKKE